MNSIGDTMFCTPPSYPTSAAFTGYRNELVVSDIESASDQSSTSSDDTTKFRGVKERDEDRRNERTLVRGK